MRLKVLPLRYILEFQELIGRHHRLCVNLEGLYDTAVAHFPDFDSGM